MQVAHVKNYGYRSTSIPVDISGAFPRVVIGKDSAIRVDDQAISTVLAPCKYSNSIIPKEGLYWCWCSVCGARCIAGFKGKHWHPNSGRMEVASVRQVDVVQENDGIVLGASADNNGNTLLLWQIASNTLQKELLLGENAGKALNFRFSFGYSRRIAYSLEVASKVKRINALAVLAPGQAIQARCAFSNITIDLALTYTTDQRVEVSYSNLACLEVASA